MGEPNKTQKTPNTTAQNAFPIVGIGASAGGLDAIKKLLENLPQKTGLALVIVQHLATGQESMLPEILSRSTKMMVLKVENGMKVLPNHVYVIPSGKTMTIQNATLHLQPKGTSLKPINEFLSSLAADQKTYAVGIVLSGTGTDGTEGLQTIKAEGGISFAQDPKSAQYPDMPKYAIDAETVDFVFTPEKIAKELNRIANHPQIISQEATESNKRSRDSTESIFGLLRASFGVDFTEYKKSTIGRRITRRMVLNKIENTKNYAAYLQLHHDELEALFNDLLIGVTRFFREPNTFQLLHDKVFSELVEKKMHNQPIRVWIPGCSTGEDVYSIAIAIEEFFAEKNIVDAQVQIFGTDVNQKNVEKARRGIYLKSIEENVSQNHLKRFFAPVNGSYQVTKHIRDMCVFAKHDLTKDPPFSNLDLIVCRNVLIYFDVALQERIMPAFHYGLKQGGFLVLGESESVGKYTFLFEALSKRGVLFKKKLAQPRFEPQFGPIVPFALKSLTKQIEKTDPMIVLRGEVDHLLMTECVPASLVVNANLDVLVFRGKVNPYISVDSGDASLNVAKIVRRELRPALQTAIYRAKKTRKDIRETVRLVQGRQTRTINIHVKIVEASRHVEPYFLVLFEEIAKGKLAPQKAGGVSESGQVESVKDLQLKELSEDLDSTKLTLQTVIEQQEATNEELRSSMEELQSSNEELMTMNEEVETAKEELQSTNEELSTLNDELRNRNVSLNVLNDDLANLMENVDTAVVIVDSEFKIRRFTSSAQTLLRLMPSDVDRPIEAIRLGLPIDNLADLLSKAAKLEVVRQEVPAGKGRWYQMRIRPYLTQEKKALGFVISFADITEVKTLEDKLRVVSSFTRHDVRNKLMAINGHLYLAKKLAKDQPEIEKHLNQIPDAIAKIDKILDVSKSYEMLGTQEIVSMDVGKSVDDAASLFGDLKGAKIINEVRGLKVLADPMLTTVFSNLIDNTLKYGEKTTQIRIYAKEQPDDSISVVYADDGVGISSEDKKGLFGKGFGKGTGFGLFLIKKACEIYGWTIQEAGEPGKGAKFVITVPKLNK